MNITIKNLTKTYNNKNILDINKCSIKKGKITGILGSNGAGKSTLINIIAGLLQATNGQVLYNNSTIDKQIFYQMTMVFQKPYLLRNTVYNNIAYPLKVRKLSKETISSKVKRIINQMDLDYITWEKAWKISGGEAQKVALARALVFEPSLLILDEPTSNIDPVSIFTMEKMIKKVRHEKGITVIIVTHNLQQAKRLCDELIFMHKGKIVEQGEANKIISNPEYKITRDFVNGELLID